MSKKYYEEKYGLNSFILRLFAIICMIYSVYCGNPKAVFADEAIASCAYWFGYTVFAFLLAEGVSHTSDKVLYFRRMLIFTALTEPCYDLYFTGKLWDTSMQSPMLIFFMCFCIMLFCDFIREKVQNIIITIIAIVSLSLGAINLAKYLNCEFAEYGVLIIMLFYASTNLTYKKLFQFALMAYYVFTVSTDTVISLQLGETQFSVPIAMFALLALFFTWVYNGKRGPNPLLLKILFYIVYPLTLIICYYIFNFL